MKENRKIYQMWAGRRKWNATFRAEYKAYPEHKSWSLVQDKIRKPIYFSR